MEKATELEYLQWFYANCDFGPAHCDVILGMEEEFRDETGLEVPDGYGYE